MNKEEIRLAVGLFLGWNKTEVGRWASPRGRIHRTTWDELPRGMKDPCEDYGTAHEAFMTLSWAQREEAVGHLYRDTEIMEKDYELDLSPATVAAALLSATSEQLTVAVVKAAGLWKGEPDEQ